MSPIEPRHPDGRSTEEQPRWRREFPIDTARDEYVSRRDFAKFLVLISGAMAAGQATLVGQSFLRRSRDTGEPVPIVHSDEIGREDVVRFHYPGPNDPCLLARLDDDRLLAYGQLCSHLLCPVIPDLESRRFLCPCHRGSFDLETGRPLAGPPRRPLPRILLSVENGTIHATGVELST